MSERVGPSRCVLCAADVSWAPVVYEAQVQMTSYAPSSSNQGPRMLCVGQADVGRYVICMPCWARLPGAR